MFSNLIKKLFDDVMSKTELGQRIKSSFRVKTHKKDFLSYLFDETGALGGEDKFISHVALKIEGFLLSPSDMLNDLPVMPRSLITLVDELNNDEFDINVVMSTIESEPKMAAEVIKLANSARYYRGDKKVSDLKTAFMYMGSEGLTDGVIKSYVNNYVPPLNIYWNHFGDRIWHHSNQTALYARELLSSQCGGQSKSVAYLVGLILNLGVMIIFQLMIESFRHVNPTVPANSDPFKELIDKYANRTTLVVAKHWGLPNVILNALYYQSSQSEHNNYLAKVVFEANYLSELTCLLDSDIIDDKTFKARCKSKIRSNSGLRKAKEILVAYKNREVLTPIH